jgi:ubiquinone/menaquinone biosynthesis C-methylase UbiE
LVTDQAPDREIYTNTGNTEYEQLIAQRSAGDVVHFLLPHLRTGLCVLDVGCGPGSITCDLARFVAPAQVVGIDLQPSQITAARSLAAQRGVTNVRFESGSIYELPYPDGSFDVATAVVVLFHLRDPLRALRELRRVLKPGGLVAAMDIDAGGNLVWPSLPAVERLLDFTYRVVEHNGGDPYLGRKHRSLLLEAGFERPEVHPGHNLYARQERTHQAAETYVLRLQGQAQEATILGQGWATREELDHMYLAMREWGERPDSFLYEQFFGALGWAPG